MSVFFNIFEPLDLGINGVTKTQFKSWLNSRKWAKVDSTLSEKIAKLNRIMTNMPKNVILNAWRLSDLLDVPESENIDLEIIDDSEDEYVELELCAESQKLFDSAENETDDYSDELNELDSLLALHNYHTWRPLVW